MANRLIQADEIVTCERGHPLYRITEDVFTDSKFLASQFERINPRAQLPSRHERVRACYCGAEWFRFAGEPPHFKVSVHLEDGWRHA